MRLDGKDVITWAVTHRLNGSTIARITVDDSSHAVGQIVVLSDDDGPYAPARVEQIYRQSGHRCLVCAIGYGLQDSIGPHSMRAAVGVKRQRVADWIGSQCGVSMPRCDGLLSPHFVVRRMPGWSLARSIYTSPLRLDARTNSVHVVAPDVLDLQHIKRDGMTLVVHDDLTVLPGDTYEGETIHDVTESERSKVCTLGL